MQGTLADLDLASLAAVTSLGRSSLRLEVSDPAGTLVGHLVLKAGRVVSATAGELHGRNAMHLIMRSPPSTRFRLVREPLDYVLSSALASVAELAGLEPPRLALASSELPAADVLRRSRRTSTSTGATRTRMMHGRLDEFDLPTLLQVIGMGRCYVELEILNETGTRVGIVGIKAGQIVSARTRDSNGIAAISALLSSPQSFEFAAFRSDAELGQIESLGSVSEILLRSQVHAPRPPASIEPGSITEAVSIMEGSLSEFDVATLLQTVACGRQHCALEVCDDQSVVGTIHVKSGFIVSAVAGSFTAIPAIKHLVGLRTPHRFRLHRITAALGEQAPVGSISQILLQLDPSPGTLGVTPPPSADFEQEAVTASPPSSAPVPASARRDDRVEHPIAAELLPVMEGNLADFDFRTLLEALAVTRQYSYLQILDRNHAEIGELRIKSGMMVSARAGIRDGVDALKFLLGVSQQCRFRVLTGLFNVDATPLGSVHELLAVFAARSAPLPERTSRVIRAVIPISFCLGGLIVFFLVRGGKPTATPSGERPVVQIKEEPSAEITAKEAPPAPVPPAPALPAPPPPPASSPPQPAPSSPPPAASSPPAVQAPSAGASSHVGATLSPAGPVDPTTKHLATSPTPDDPVHLGMTIKTAQTALKHLGYDPGPIDNSYGSRTKSAIVKFQTDHALHKTGVLNDETWSAIVTLLTGTR